MAIGDDAVERRMGPVFLCSRNNGNNVVMSREKNGFESWILAGPFEEEGMLRNERLFELRM